MDSACKLIIAFSVMPALLKGEGLFFYPSFAVNGNTFLHSFTLQHIYNTGRPSHSDGK